MLYGRAIHDQRSLKDVEGTLPGRRRGTDERSWFWRPGSDRHVSSAVGQPDALAGCTGPDCRVGRSERSPGADPIPRTFFSDL
jgi:hypothetical protein